MKAWDNLIILFTQMDRGNRIFEEALQKVDNYLKDLSEDTRVRAETACIDAANALLELEKIRVNLSEEDLQNFYERKIDAADYCAPFDSFRSFLRSNADSLCFMQGYLQQPSTESALRQTYLMDYQSHILSKQIDYLSLNNFVLESNLTEKEAAKFQDMLETLPSFSQIAVWETDLSILNAKLEKTFQDYENNISQYSRNVGEHFSSYLQEINTAAQKLKTLGYNDKMFEELIKKIEHNAELMGKSTMLEQSELWKKADSLKITEEDHICNTNSQKGD